MIRVNASDEDLRKVAEQIFSERVRPQFVQLLYEALDSDKRYVITERLAELANVSLDEIEKEGPKDKQIIPQDPGSIGQERRQSGEVTTLNLGPPYNVQMPHGTGNPTVTISSHWSSSTCDHDPSDSDWVFFANRPQTVHPTSMRWYSTSSHVTWALNWAYGGNLSTYGFHSHQINICLGDKGVLLAGGANNVRNNLRVKYR
jgi:hypothetical protein